MHNAHTSFLDFLRHALIPVALAAATLIVAPLRAEPPAPVPPTPTLSEAEVQHAIDQLDSLLRDVIARTRVPGVAVGVVFHDRLMWARGYGVREVGKPDPVDANTVFQLASMSKPIGSTVLAKLVGDGQLNWDDPIVSRLPDFALADPWVSQRVTIADLYSHRSGLPDHAGDDLEELGYSQAQIFHKLRLHTLDHFRAHFDYTNYGMTAAAEAAVLPLGMSWADASRDLLYRPAGMNSTTSRHDQFLATPNRATPHVRHRDGQWAADFVQQTDITSPAAGVHSSVADLSRWMRLQLNGGVLDGVRLVDAKALARTHVPHQTLAFDTDYYNDRPVQYGLGWFISVDELGQARWAHDGAFALGASTSTILVPSQGLGVVVLTNGFPIGIAESMTTTFLDLAFHGKPSRDWFAYYNAIFEAALYPTPDIDYTTPPADATPPRSLAEYTGTYLHDYYGPGEVVRRGSQQLAIVLGSARREFPLTHYSGDTFWYLPPGEYGVAPSAATFTFDSRGGARLTLRHLSSLKYEMGAFRRRAPIAPCESRPARACSPR